MEEDAVFAQGDEHLDPAAFQTVVEEGTGRWKHHFQGRIFGHSAGPSNLLPSGSLVTHSQRCYYQLFHSPQFNAITLLPGVTDRTHRSKMIFDKAVYAHRMRAAHHTHTATPPDGQLPWISVGALQSSTCLPRDINDHTGPQSPGNIVTAAQAIVQMSKRCPDPIVCYLMHCPLCWYSGSLYTLLLAELHLRFHGRAEEEGLS